MATKSIYSQFKDIRKEVRKMSDEIAKELSKEAVEDLKDVHKQIMEDFYGTYTPDQYVRTDNLKKNSIIPQNPIGEWGGYVNTYDAGIVVGSFNMYDNYNISPDNVFDLMWNKGVRGLPKVGKNPMDNGEKWENPTWKSQYGEKQNVFRTSVTLGRYTSREGTPAQVMEDIANHWREANGDAACELIVKRIKNKYR